MADRVTIIVRRTGRRLTAESFRPGRTAMQKVGDLIARKTRERTRSGRDVDGRFFTGYADGRGGHVDLTDSGQMLDDLGVTRVSESSVTVDFRSARSRKLADIHQNGRGRMPVRRFIGVSKAWMKEIRDLMAAGLRAKLRSR